jgi:pre-mRNA-splicing factor SPF27
MAGGMQVVVSGEAAEGKAHSAARNLLEAQQAEAAETVAGSKRNFRLVDSLPYIDRIDTALRSRAEKMIQDELKVLAKKPSDYLRELPQAEEVDLDRFSSGEPTTALDVSRYNLEPPAGAEAEDPSAWQAALRNAKSQLEHQSLRVENLELMLKGGANVWRASNMQLEGLCNTLEGATDNLEAQVEALNRERKLQQFSTGNEIHSLEGDWYRQIHKNLEIDHACKQLEQQQQEISQAKQ